MTSASRFRWSLLLAAALALPSFACDEVIYRTVSADTGHPHGDDAGDGGHEHDDDAGDGGHHHGDDAGDGGHNHGDDAGDGGHNHGDDAGDGGHGGHGGHGDGGQGGHGMTDPDAWTPSRVALGESIFRDRCAACHTMGRGNTRRGPDLLTTALKPDMWLRNWIADPAGWAEQNPYARRIVDEWQKTMPDLGLDAEEIESVIAFLRTQQAIGPLEPVAPVTLSPEAFDETTALYFNRCAGCHGTQRGGATGPALTPSLSSVLGTDTLRAVLRHGSPWGMPDWGDSGRLSPDEVDRLAAWLQLPVPEAEGRTLEQIEASWELIVPVDERPIAPEHARDWSNFFGVVLRDSGQVAILDGDTREVIAKLPVGTATHILRTSATGRYFHAVGRDGQVTMIDLWTATPTVVARVRGCWDSRSVEPSRLPGWEDRYVVQGCFWPAQFVVYEGDTLRPLRLGTLRHDAVDTGETIGEVRVAAIVSSRFAPEWVLSLKESGWAMFVSYADPTFPTVATVAGERFLHDGGLDASGRHFIAAANARNRMVVFDLQERTLAGSFGVRAVPHPGRGANWEDPTFGKVNATGHIGSRIFTVYGADPEGAPDHAWRVVREVELPSAGSLFVRTHPASPWVVADMTMSDNPEHAQSLCVYGKASGRIERCIRLSNRGQLVHPEFNRDGTELWVSVWHEQGELIVLDARTLEELHRIPGLATPTGKFNVHNGVHEVY